MRKPYAMKIVEFQRDDPGGRASCVVKAFGDGSVSITGADVGGIFEECSDAFERAVKYVEAKGYVKFRELQA